LCHSRGVVERAGRALFGVDVGRQDDALSGAGPFAGDNVAAVGWEPLRPALQETICPTFSASRFPSSSVMNTDGISKSPSSIRGKG